MSNPTIGDVLEIAARRLTTAGIPRPRLDARLLICEALGVGPEIILGYPERPVAAGALQTIDRLIEERTSRRPIAQILGHREFWGLPFSVTEKTLTPRPESETVIEMALDLVDGRDNTYRVLDLGTGTGCLLLSLLNELQNATGLGVDLSEFVLPVAARNARSLGLTARADFVAGNWGEGLEGPFDICLCNPPYIAEGDIDGLEPEVSTFEPRLALAGGADGLDCYRVILWQLPGLLSAGGLAIFEVGAGQAAAVAAMAQERGFELIEIRADLAGIERGVAVRHLEAKVGIPAEN